MISLDIVDENEGPSTHWLSQAIRLKCDRVQDVCLLKQVEGFYPRTRRLHNEGVLVGCFKPGDRCRASGEVRANFGILDSLQGPSHVFRGQLTSSVELHAVAQAELDLPVIVGDV